MKFPALLIFLAPLLSNAECFDVINPPADYIKNYKQKVSTITGNALITIIPDQHNIRFAAASTEKYLKKMKEEKVTTLFIEMLPSNVTIDPSLPLPTDLKEMLDGKIKNPWPSDHYFSLITAAHKLGIKVEGYYPTAAEYDKVPSPQRDHDNLADKIYTINILRKIKPNEKVVILTGAAHANAFYEQNDVSTNTHLLGEFIFHGIDPKKINVIFLAETNFSESSDEYNLFANKEYNSFSEDFVLPLPVGKRPGCSDDDYYSYIRKILFVRDVDSKL